MHNSESVLQYTSLLLQLYISELGATSIIQPNPISTHALSHAIGLGRDSTTRFSWQIDRQFRTLRLNAETSHCIPDKLEALVLDIFGRKILVKKLEQASKTIAIRAGQEFRVSGAAIISHKTPECIGLERKHYRSGRALNPRGRESTVYASWDSGVRTVHIKHPETISRALERGGLSPLDPIASTPQFFDFIPPTALKGSISRRDLHGISSHCALEFKNLPIRVTDANLACMAYAFGLGARRSYGFGFLSFQQRAK